MPKPQSLTQRAALAYILMTSSICSSFKASSKARIFWLMSALISSPKTTATEVSPVIRIWG